MSYFRTCLLCGSNLDPNEVCDCQTTAKKNEEHYNKLLVCIDGQYKLGGTFINEYNKNND